MQNIKDQLNTVVKLFNSGEKQKAFEKIKLDDRHLEVSVLFEGNTKGRLFADRR